MTIRNINTLTKKDCKREEKLNLWENILKSTKYVFKSNGEKKILFKKTKL